MSPARPAWTAAIAGLLLACLFILPAHAASISDITNWRSLQLRWFDRGGLPTDNEFSAPLVAQYNWAYGATVLGVTARRIDSNDYYALLAVDDGERLSALDTLGPFTSAAQFHTGRYHVAVAQPDGRIYIWLTAPGEDPRRLLLASDALPGAPLACIALPPDPPSAKWAEWSIYLACCLDADPPYLDVTRYTGTGKSMGQVFGVSLPSALNAITLIGGDGPAPQVLFSVLDTPATRNSTAQVGVYLAARSANWYTQRVTNAGVRGAMLHPGAVGAWETALALMDTGSTGFFLQQLQFATLDSGMQPKLGGYDFFRTPFSPQRISLFESTRSALPMLAFSDGADLTLVWRGTRGGRDGGSLGTAMLGLHQGETDAQGAPFYPITAVAGAAHWSTGDPTVYWVQQGSIDNDTGQLFRIALKPGAS